MAANERCSSSSDITVHVFRTFVRARRAGVGCTSSDRDRLVETLKLQGVHGILRRSVTDARHYYAASTAVACVGDDRTLGAVECSVLQSTEGNLFRFSNNATAFTEIVQQLHMHLATECLERRDLIVVRYLFQCERSCRSICLRARHAGPVQDMRHSCC
jgi:hypothetical protein